MSQIIYLSIDVDILLYYGVGTFWATTFVGYFELATKCNTSLQRDK